MLNKLILKKKTLLKENLCDENGVCVLTIGWSAVVGNLSTRRFLRGDGNRNSNLLPIHVSRRHGQPSRLGADFVLLILTSLVKCEFRLYDFRSFVSFCPQFFVLIDA